MRRRTWLPGLIGGVMLLALQAVAVQAEPTVTDQNDKLYKQLELFEQALSIVRSDYVEQPEAEQLIYGALKGMLATLDPYSQFLDPDSYNELKIETGGEFGGLGIEITIKDELLTVISPIDDTPAYKAGLKPGDRIVKIDGEITRGITLHDAVKKLRGKPGTSVMLTILREGDNALKDVTLTRDNIKFASVREAKILEDHIGYIRLSDFQSNTPHDMNEAISKLRAENMDSIVFDLRNNPGGLLDVAVSVSELFLNQQQIILTTKGRLRNQNMEFRASRDGIINNLPLVVLINEGSASASEIVAGAIQDHKRGVLIGAKSHGKGSVQTVFPLKDGSALRLTTSKWFTPSGRPIHGTGIMPDVVVPFEAPPEEKEKSKNQQSKEIFEKVESENANKTAAPSAAGESKAAEPKATEPKMDSQLARAVDLLKGIKVYQSKEKATP